jgi:signal transduction histidine kinase
MDAIVIFSATATALVSSLMLAAGTQAPVVEGELPAWLRPVELAALAVMVAGAWAVRVHHPRASTGLAVATAGSLLPLWAAWPLLPGTVRAGLLAAAPFTVAGIARVALGWPAGVPASARLVGRAVVLLAAAASLAHLLGYNPFADPGCARICEDVQPVLAGVLATRSAVAISGLLTIVAAVLAAGAVLRGGPRRAPRSVIGAVVLALCVLATSSALRWAGWEDPTPSVTLPVLESLAVAVVGAVLGVVGIRTVRTRAAVDRLGTQLSRLEAGLGDVSGAIRGVQFAVPGEARWVDTAGRDVGDAPAPGSYVVLSDEAGPVLRLVLAGRADHGEILAGLTPATRLALRNAQLAAVARARLADVQASQRRVVATSDAERRRIERDLHDGAQQRLVSVAFHLRVALAGVDPATSVQLTSAEARIRDALAHLRQLAHGIFPNVLANDGLEAAIDELLAASDVPTVLDIQVDNVDADAAMAAYATLAAALDSVERPSTATRALVSAVQDGDTLTVRVTMHAGGQTTRAGAFTEVADRVGAIGGRFTLSDTPDDETVVTAVIPCAS